jgi:adenylylsulfate kinase
LPLKLLIYPFRADRDSVRTMVKELDSFEIYCKCPVQERERRDTRGLYMKARLVIVKEFMGISSPYEEPLNSELVLDTHELTIEACVDRVVTFSRIVASFLCEPEPLHAR